jgi:hypothetical protein
LESSTDRERPLTVTLVKTYNQYWPNIGSISTNIYWCHWAFTNSIGHWNPNTNQHTNALVIGIFDHQYSPIPLAIGTPMSTNTPTHWSLGPSITSIPQFRWLLGPQCHPTHQRIGPVIVDDRTAVYLCRSPPSMDPPTFTPHINARHPRIRVYVSMLT